MHDPFYLSRLPNRWQSRVYRQASQPQVWADRWGWSPSSCWQALPNAPARCHWWCHCDPARRRNPCGGWFYPPYSIPLLRERPWRSSCGVYPNTCASNRGYSVGWKACRRLILEFVLIFFFGKQTSSYRATLTFIWSHVMHNLMNGSLADKRSNIFMN